MKSWFKKLLKYMASEFEIIEFCVYKIITLLNGEITTLLEFELVGVLCIRNFEILKAL